MSWSVIGIDPGVSGGIAVLNHRGRPLFVEPFRPKMSRSEAIAVVRQAVDTATLGMKDGTICFFEKVGYIGKRDGRKGDGGKGAFTFGRIVGILETAVEMRGVRIRYVLPLVWQGAMGCLTGGQKNVSKAAALRLFPHLKVTHAVADALLIAEHGRRRVLARRGRAATS